MANEIKQIKVGNTTYNIEPYSSYYRDGCSNFEMNSGGSLLGYGGFIDFHFFNSSGKPLNSEGTVVSTTPDYTSRIIEDSAGRIAINGNTYITWSGLTSNSITSNDTISAKSITADSLTTQSITHASEEENLTIGNSANNAYVEFVEDVQIGDLVINAQDGHITGIEKIAIGAGSNASGAYSVALGYLAYATATGAIAIGYNPTASGYYSIAAGYQARAIATAGIALGYSAEATATGGIAIGYNPTASGYYSIAAGYSSKATGTGGIAIGYNPTASSYYSIAAGYSSKATGTGAIALGYAAYATATGGIAIGYNPGSSGYYSIAAGYQAKATATAGIALGYSAEATATGGIAIGYDSTSSDYYSIGLGYKAQSASHSIMIGANVSSSSAKIEQSAIAIGSGAPAQKDSNGTHTPSAIYAGTGAVAIGSAYSTIKSGWAVTRDAPYARSFGVAIGSGATATGSNSVALGTNTDSYGVAVGSSSKAYGSNCIAIGSVAYAGSSSNLDSTSPSTGGYSIAIGYGVSAGVSSSRSLIKIGQTSHNTYFYSGTSSSWSKGSDIRDKTNIQPIYGGIDLIKNVQPISFQYNFRNAYSDTASFLDYDVEEHKKETKVDDELNFGFAAQEVANYFDRVYGDEKINNIVGHDYEVDTDTGETADYYSIAEGGFIPFLFQAIKEQQDIIESLEERIIKLENILTKEG